MANVTIKDEYNNIISEYYLDNRLKSNLDRKKIDLNKKDKDSFMIIDGPEGAGKSTLAFQIGKYFDPTLNLSRVVFSPDDFRDAILKAKKGQCIIYDEAFTGFSSRSSLSPINRVLVSLAMQMRQKNLFILIVLPTVYLLDKYIAMFRAKALIHVYESKSRDGKPSRRGYFIVFNRKKLKYLLLLGSKTMSYNVKGVYSNFKGRFYGRFALGDKKIEDKYRKNKEQALSDSEKTSMSSAQVRYKDQRDLVIWLFRNYTNLNYKQIEELLFEYDFNMSYVQISRICAKFGEISADKIKKSNNIVIEDIKNDEIEKEETKEVIINDEVQDNTNYEDNLDELPDDNDDSDDFS